MNVVPPGEANDELTISASPADLDDDITITDDVKASPTDVDVTPTESHNGNML